MVALYNATDGAHWTDNTNWLSAEPIGTWDGVTTDANGRVTALHLYHHNLSGSIPAALGALDSLTLLHLHNNELSGSIPAELGRLVNLTHLTLYTNELSGPIPRELGNLANLTLLSITNNDIGGSIPSELGSLNQPDRHVPPKRRFGVERVDTK